jgi:hypothetical protein
MDGPSLSKERLEVGVKPTNAKGVLDYEINVGV